VFCPDAARRVAAQSSATYSAQTNYTSQQESLRAQVGLKLNHAWQLRYTARLSIVDILPGTLPGLACRYWSVRATRKPMMSSR